METARHLPRSCKPEPGGVLAVVDRGRCEAKSACVAVCPYDVFEVRALTSGERAAMPVWGRLNLRPHRGRQAVVVAPETAATRAAFVFVPAKKGPSACSARWPDMRRDQTIELTCSASTAWEIIGDYGNDAWWRGEVAGITSQPQGRSMPGPKCWDWRRAGRVGLLTGIAPVSAAMCGMLTGSYVLAPLVWAGLLVVMAGVAAGLWSPRDRPARYTPCQLRGPGSGGGQAEGPNGLVTCRMRAAKRHRVTGAGGYRGAAGARLVLVGSPTLWSKGHHR